MKKNPLRESDEAETVLVALKNSERPFNNYQKHLQFMKKNILAGYSCAYRNNLRKVLLIMKLSAIFLLAFCLSASAGGYSQHVTLSFKKASAFKVFSQIEKQTGFGFIEQVEHGSYYQLLRF